MAAEWDETCLDVSISDYGADTVIRLQAICRGWFVRKKLNDTRTEFQEIVHELEGPSVKVEWTQSALPHPVVCKASKRTRAWKSRQDQKHTCGQSDESKSSSSKPVTEAECLKCAEKRLTHTKTETVAKPNSAATQSDQKVQTEFSQTDQLLLMSKDMHAEEGKKHEPTATDSMLPVKESVCQTDKNLQSDVSQNQDCAEKHSLNTQTDPKVVVENSRGEHQTGADSDSDSDGRHMNSHVSTSSDMAASHVSMLPSPIVVSSEAVTESALESSSMRRVNSFLYGDQTSVWDSNSSILQDHETASKRPRGGQPHSHGSGSAGKVASLETGADMTEVTLRSLSTEELLKQRQSVAMELLWVQQAIISRKKYLKLKMQMDAAA